jgi:hypothetical protein
VLFSERKAQQELAEAEAQGESFWTDNFSEPVRVKLWHAFFDAAERRSIAVIGYARGDLLRSMGKLTLTTRSPNESSDLYNWLTSCPSGQMPDAIEAMIDGVKKEDARIEGLAMIPRPSEGWRALAGAFNDILNQHRISYRIVEAQVVEFQSMELHESVVEPTLRLLSGDSRYADAETAYQDALREISSGKPADAVTDAASALEQVLVTLGCAGTTIGTRLDSARNKGLLGGHDVSLLKRVGDWVNADRSNKGDVHTSPTEERDDAWLTVHVVGAFILRIAAANAAPR